jgi:hypothetical protein
VTIADNCTLEGTAVANTVIYDNTLIENVDEIIIDSLIGKNSHVWQAGHKSTSFFVGDYCSLRLTKGTYAVASDPAVFSHYLNHLWCSDGHINPGCIGSRHHPVDRNISTNDRLVPKPVHPI